MLPSWGRQSARARSVSLCAVGPSALHAHTSLAGLTPGEAAETSGTSVIPANNNKFFLF